MGQVIIYECDSCGDRCNGRPWEEQNIANGWQEVCYGLPDKPHFRAFFCPRCLRHLVDWIDDNRKEDRSKDKNLRCSINSGDLQMICLALVLMTVQRPGFVYAVDTLTDRLGINARRILEKFKDIHVANGGIPQSDIIEVVRKQADVSTKGSTECVSNASNSHYPRLAYRINKDGSGGTNLEILGCSCGWDIDPSSSNPDDDFSLHAGLSFKRS